MHWKILNVPLSKCCSRIYFIDPVLRRCRGRRHGIAGEMEGMVCTVGVGRQKSNKATEAYGRTDGRKDYVRD
jgi:hypothetical protein